MIFNVFLHLALNVVKLRIELVVLGLTRFGEVAVCHEKKED